MIRAILSVSRKVNKLKDEYPKLYKDFQEARKGNDYRTNTWIHVSDETYKEYLALVENHLAVKKFPSNNRKVWVTTHNGGKFVGFYEGGKWWYNTADDKVIEVDAQVIKWGKY